MKAFKPALLLGLASSLFAGCYAADNGDSAQLAGRGQLSTLSVGSLPDYAYVTEISSAGDFGVYTTLAPKTDGSPAMISIAAGTQIGVTSIPVLPGPGSTDSPNILSALVSAGKIAFKVSQCDPTTNHGTYGTCMASDAYTSAAPDVGGQASIQRRADRRFVMLARKLPKDADQNGVRQVKVDGGLLLMTLDASLKETGREPVGGVYAINPVVAIDAMSDAYVAAWQDEQTGQTSVQAVDASGAKRAFANVLTGSPVRAWTDGKTFRLLATDDAGTLWISNDGAKPVQLAATDASRTCTTTDFSDDGTLLSLAVGDDSVQLISTPVDGAASTLTLAGPISPDVEVSRLPSCAVSHTGSRINVAWKGTQSIGANADAGYIYQAVENGKIAEQHRIALDKSPKVTTQFAFEGTGAVVYGKYGDQYCTSDGAQVPNPNSYYGYPSMCADLSTVAGIGITITALPTYEGWTFIGWSGGGKPDDWSPGCDGSTELTCVLSPRQQTTRLVARYAQPRLVISGTNGGNTVPGGDITSMPAGIADCSTTHIDEGGCRIGGAPGTQITLIATPFEPYEFVGWNGFPGCEDNSLNCTITLTGETQTVTPVFRREADLLTVSVGSGTSASGKVVSTSALNPEGDPAIDCGTACKTKLHEGNSTLVLTAIPGPASMFTGWSNCPHITGDQGEKCEINWSPTTNYSPLQINVYASFWVN